MVTRDIITYARSPTDDPHDGKLQKGEKTADTVDISKDEVEVNIHNLEH